MITSPAAKGLSLQWKMLIGFVTGLVLGLIAYSTQRDAAWVEIVAQPLLPEDEDAEFP